MHQEYGLVAFDSTHEAIRTEVLVKEKQFHARLIGTPGQISAGCGLSLRYDLSDTDRLEQVLSDDQVSYQGIYHAKRDGLASQYKLIRK